MALLDALHGLSWPAHRRASGRWSGHHPSHRIGRATELTEYRAYRAGDDSRDVDWKLLARSDRPFVRLAEVWATHPTALVVDASASMAFPAPTLDKWRTATTVAHALAFLAHRAGDPVELCLATAPPRTLPASTRPDAVPRIEALLAEARPGGTTPLAPLIAALPRRARVVVLSDFLGDADAVLGVLRARMADGGEVIGVRILSAEERDPRVTGSVVDPEDPSCERTINGAALVAYRAAFGQWMDEVRDAWHAVGAAFHEVEAGVDPVAAVRRIVAGDPVTGSR